ncbi:uncharacterized protein DFL_009846 [Arthrobotrys flagrans]|uniref:Uncharacterized protein n=1 Tax=Arthrobotrys flagrans TaxID=97331 RepID=A0A436ZT25_ARTFL|nr:hypothetical protein DFL_009846 [Arthrobotrys flagrans]
MSVYTIVINNRSPKDRSFNIYTEPPNADKSPSTRYGNIFRRSSMTAAKTGQTTFKIQKRPFAIVSTTEGSLEYGNSVYTSQMEEVNLGSPTQKATVLHVEYKNRSAKITGKREAEKLNDPPGGFVISTGSFEPPTNNFRIGLGADCHGENIPLSVFIPRPNNIYNIFPVKKFYVVVDGDLLPGQTISVEPSSTKVQILDFGTAETDTFVLDYTESGEFKIKTNS